MSKRELIDSICEINTHAKPQFLAEFSEEDLEAYLENLREIELQPAGQVCVRDFT
jgi:hypothetical protein